MGAVGQLWLNGLQIDWQNYYEPERRRRVPLPSYPFERKRFWIEPSRDICRTSLISESQAAQNEDMRGISTHSKEVPSSLPSSGDDYDAPRSEAELLLAVTWREVLGVERITLNDNYFADLGGDSLSVLRVIEIIRKKTGLRLEPNLILLNTLRQIAAHMSHQQSPAGERLPVVETKPQTPPCVPAGRGRQEITPLYFGESREKLFGIYHAPRPRSGRDEGILLCYPIGQEYMVSHWAFRKLSNLLSRAGFHVFRFDYFGTGDSAGESGGGTVSRWIADVRSAVRELQRISGLNTVSIVGLRMGAALAAEACALDVHMKNLVLWDPVVSGKKYMEELAVMHRRYYAFFQEQKTESAPDELVGFTFPVEMRTSIEQIELLELSEVRSERIFLVGTEQRDEYSALKKHFSSLGIQLVHDVFIREDGSKSDSRGWEGEILEDGLLPIKTEILSIIATLLDRGSE